MRWSSMEYWIHKGELVPAPECSVENGVSEKDLLTRRGMVKIVAGEGGTSVTWYAAAANWSSLMLAKEWIGTSSAPYTLSYFLSGWFSETLSDPEAAKRRLDHLIAKSDLHLSSRIYTKSFDPETYEVPEPFKGILAAGAAPEESSIDVAVDEQTGRVRVERIGPKSAIARLWGASPVSFPCLSGNTYDKVVSECYREVVRTGRPHYDHICAAMMHPDGEIHWVPYQRIVLQIPASGRRKLVRVVSEVMPVEIAVV